MSVWVHPHQRWATSECAHYGVLLLSRPVFHVWSFTGSNICRTSLRTAPSASAVSSGMSPRVCRTTLRSSSTYNSVQGMPHVREVSTYARYATCVSVLGMVQKDSAHLCWCCHAHQEHIHARRSAATTHGRWLTAVANADARCHAHSITAGWKAQQPGFRVSMQLQRHPLEPVLDGDACEVGALGRAQLLRLYRRRLHLVRGGVPRRRVLQAWRRGYSLTDMSRTARAGMQEGGSIHGSHRASALGTR